jgi:hypothetical protein
VPSGWNLVAIQPSSWALPAQPAFMRLRVGMNGRRTTIDCTEGAWGFGMSCESCFRNVIKDVATIAIAAIVARMKICVKVGVGS